MVFYAQGLFNVVDGVVLVLLHGVVVKMSIDWKQFEGSYVKIADGQTKRMALSDWELVESKFKNEGDDKGKPALNFSVLEEDGVACLPGRQWELSNVKAIKLLRPIVEKAEAFGAKVVYVQVTRVGSGTSTVYAVSEYGPIV